MQNSEINAGIKIAFFLASLLAAFGIMFLFSHKGEKDTRPNISDLSSSEISIPAIKYREKIETTVQVKKTAKILFVGDLMLDRYIRELAERKGVDYVFEKISPLLKENDLVVANLEGPITENESISKGTASGVRENYFFTFDPSMAGVLAKQNIKLVSLGNNHILNFKEDGVHETKRFLQGSGVEHFCSPLADDERLIMKDINGLQIGFVCYNQFVSGGREKAFSDIQKVKGSADAIILYAHWGKEYETQPLESVKNLAHEFVDGGVDIIIGSHPHVVQEKELYKEKTIYYSLGNFIFDQYFQKETKEGLAVQITFDSDSAPIFSEYKLILSSNGQTSYESNK